MVQFSTAAAVAFMAATASASPFDMIHKRLSSYSFTVFNYNPDPSVHVDYTTRTEQLFVEPGHCTTLENMWDKETSFITVGAGISCVYYVTEDCSYTSVQRDYYTWSGTATEASSPLDLGAVSNLQGNVNSYLCNELSAVYDGPVVTTGSYIPPTSTQGSLPGGTNLSRP